MRRVYDDSKYCQIRKQIMDVVSLMPASAVSEYSWGTERASVAKIREYVSTRVPVKYGRNEHAKGIGNNNAIEIIVTDGNEEQICGLLHLTDDMYGGVICWVSDIDGGRKSNTRKIRP